MEIINFIFGPTIVIIIGGLTTSIFGYLVLTSKKAHIPKWIAVGAFIGGLFTIGGGILASFEQSQKDNELLNNVKGADSYCNIFVPAWSIGDKFYSTLNHKGVYPLYDVEFKITNITKLNKLIDSNQVTKSGLHKYEKTIRIGNIPPSKSIEGIQLDIDNMENQKYRIDYIARNGTWIQEILLYREKRIPIKNNMRLWHPASRIKRNGKFLVLLEHPMYPRNEDGKIDWVLK